MRNHTESEGIVNQRIQAFNLKKLYFSNRNQFEEIIGLLPFMVIIHDRRSLHIKLVNAKVEQAIGYSNDEIVDKGPALIRKLSDISLFNHSIHKIKCFDQVADPQSVCSYWQNIKMYGKMSFVYSHKIILDDENHLTIGYAITEFGQMGTMISDILSDVAGGPNIWKKFQSLTKREKEILNMLAKGLTNLQIGDQLFLSSNTVRTHRNRIYKKLDIRHFKDVIHYTQAFKLLF